jgi:hypothetical protein
MENKKIYLTEVQLIEEIDNWIWNHPDVDLLAKFAENIFQGNCNFNENLFFEFSPNENYDGDLDDYTGEEWEEEDN